MATRKPKSTDEHREPHLPHEETSTQVLGIAFTVGVAAAAIAGTLALFA